MKLTSIQFYRYALLFPYIVAILMLFFAYQGLRPDGMFGQTSANENLSDFSKAVLSVIGVFAIYMVITGMIYSFGVLYWFLPYTILVVFLWVWSLKKNKSQIYRMFMCSPLILAVLINIYYIVVVIFFPSMNILGDDFVSTSLLCLFPTPILFGYLFIGMTAFIYDFFRRRGVIVDEDIILTEGVSRN